MKINFRPCNCKRENFLIEVEQTINDLTSMQFNELLLD